MALVPAFATGGDASVTVMRSVDTWQLPLVIVQRKVYDPAVRPVIVVTGLFGEVIVAAAPLCCVQRPVAGDAEFAAIVAVAGKVVQRF